jgi:hypothetical protein
MDFCFYFGDTAPQQTCPDSKPRMPTTLRKTDIRDACGERAYVRGLDYLRQNRVVDWTERVGEHAIEIDARVRGSAVYRQQIIVRQFGVHREIDGECSCPVGYNCKHVASVLLAWHAAQADTDPAGVRVQRWLDRLAALYTDGQAGTAQDSPALCYVLAPVDGDAGRVSVRLQSARLKEDGSARGRPITLPVHDRGQPRIRQACRPGDDDILRLLASLPGEFAPFLHGELGALVLRRMHETRRLFWQDIHTPPLQPGEPLQAKLAWEYDAGSYRVGLATGADPLIPVLVDPPAYIDAAARRLGALQIAPDIDGRLLAALIEAPAIPEAIARDVSDQLLRRLPQARLPLPADIPVEELTDLSPTPVLRLSVTPDSGRRDSRDYRLALCFDYAGHRVRGPFRPLAQFADGDRVLRVQRRADAEDAAAARLRALGFTPAAAGGDVDQVFQPPADGDELAAWADLVAQGLPALTAAGWIVERAADFDLRFSDVDGLRIDARQADGWFDIGVTVEVEGQPVDLVPLLASLAERIDDPALLDPATPVLVEASPGHWLRLPAAQAAPLLGALFDLLGRDSRRPARLVARRADAARLARLDDTGVAWHGATDLHDLARRLAETPRAPRARDLQAELRPYQAEGVAWLQQRCALGFGCLLADDMGLGKTLQVLAHLQIEKEAGRLDEPALVVVPTSLVSNWASEARRFTPSLRVLILHGPGRKALFDDIGDADLVLTTYPLLPRDEKALAGREYHSLILDEAQNVKNPHAKAAQAARRVGARHRVCLTGTPIENHLGELWSLFHFLSPGFLGDQNQFRRQFRVPIEQHGDERRSAPAAAHRAFPAAPHEAGGRQRTAGEGRDHTHGPSNRESGRALRERAGGHGRARFAMPSTTRAWRAATSPSSRPCSSCARSAVTRACSNSSAHPRRCVQRSWTLLLEMLPELLDEGRRILLFSQFTSMLGLIEQSCRRWGSATAS